MRGPFQKGILRINKSVWVGLYFFDPVNTINDLHQMRCLIDHC